MFFRDQFISISECIDAHFRGTQRRGQNPADKGELCEIFVQEALSTLFSNQYSVLRGGKVIDSKNSESCQVDIVMTSKNALSIFQNKGVYPIETVYGIVFVTSTLDSAKFWKSLQDVASIPKCSAKFHYIFDWKNVKQDHEEVFRSRLPYKVLFGFAGNIADKAENIVTELNKKVSIGEMAKNELPDLIVVNMKVLIEKINSPCALDTFGKKIEEDFVCADISSNPGLFLSMMACELHKLSSWQHVVQPDYIPYFNADLLQ